MLVTYWKEGIAMLVSTPTMSITISSSNSVKPEAGFVAVNFMACILGPFTCSKLTIAGADVRIVTAVAKSGGSGR